MLFRAVAREHGFLLPEGHDPSGDILTRWAGCKNGSYYEWNHNGMEYIYMDYIVLYHVVPVGISWNGTIMEHNGL